MVDAAAWIALAATCVAALMTAANLGVRVTGWGFVVFAVGAVAWMVVGLATDQAQLLYSNVFLGLVDLFGVWRWLGHRARISDTSSAEEDRSGGAEGERRFSLAKLDGLPIVAANGRTAAVTVDALASCNGGRIRYLVVRRGGLGGIGETLHRLPWSVVELSGDKVLTDMDEAAFAALPIASPE